MSSDRTRMVSDAINTLEKHSSPVASSASGKRVIKLDKTEEKKRRASERSKFSPQALQSPHTLLKEEYLTSHDAESNDNEFSKKEPRSVIIGTDEDRFGSLGAKSISQGNHYATQHEDINSSMSSHSGEEKEVNHDDDQELKGQKKSGAKRKKKRERRKEKKA